MGRTYDATSRSWLGKRPRDKPHTRLEDDIKFTAGPAWVRDNIFIEIYLRLNKLEKFKDFKTFVYGHEIKKKISNLTYKNLIDFY